MSWGLLIVVGIGAYYGYIAYAIEAAWHLKNLSPIALVIAAAGVIAGHRDPLNGGGLIVLAYIIEYIVGSKLFRDFESESRLGSLLFLTGVTIFIIGLPFRVLNKTIVLVPLTGTIIKLAGLILILAAQACQEETGQAP
jgi:hypothetical protein